MKTEPLVSLIILNYNGAELTCALLKSVQQLSYSNIEVIVVDNHSARNPAPLIREQALTNTLVILNNENLGFAGGNNVGIRQARGDFFLFLNNDTEVTPDLIERLLEPFSTDSSIGVTCPKIRYHQQPDLIQYAGYTPLNSFTGQAWAIGNQQVDRGQFNRAGVTSFAHGAAMLVKRGVVEQAGLMPELYFLYYEELDWCCRIRRAGYQIYYQASAVVYHKESMTVGKSNPLKVYYQTRNRILFMRRNAPPFPLLIFLIYYAGLAFPKALILYSLKGQIPFVKAVLQGVAWHLNNPVARPVEHRRRSGSLTDRLPLPSR